MGYDGSLKFDTKVDESGFSSGINKLGSIAKTGLAVIGGVVAGAATMVTKSALDSVASLEQNIGGIETLFGAGGKSIEEYAASIGESTEEAKASYEQLINAQTLALENANKAYKTAGLSANEYMSTVTSFAAALKQSAADETEAAKVADMAIIDMADNANKMGTSMESIQNAYQGFAKQNYTMLDNLKLGYGGTKTEMERLLKDAEKISGIKYDISNLSDVYNAIHVIQGELGITGTTAKEAATTIEGSMNSAKAALDNFLNGSGSVDELVDSVTTAGSVIAENLGEIVPRLLETVPEAIDKLAEKATAELGNFDVGGMIESGKKITANLASGITSSAPRIAEAGLEILSSLTDTLMDSAPNITAKAGEIVSHLISGIQENAPDMLTAAVDLIASFVRGIGEQLPTLVPQALQMIVTIADGIISNIPTIVSAGLSILTGLVQGIIEGLPTLIAEGPRIINDFADAIYSAIGTLISTAWQLMIQFGQGLIAQIPLIKEHALEILQAIINMMSLSKMLSLGTKLISSLGNGIKSMLGVIKAAGGNVVTNLVNGIKAFASNPVAAIKNIATQAISAFKSFDWKSLGSNIINGIVNGLKAGVGAIVDAAKTAAKNAFDAAKEFLGIHSPSRLFRDVIGKNMALGMAVGFDGDIPAEAVEEGLDKVMRRAGKKVASINRSVPETTKGIISKVTNNYTGNGINYKKIKQAQKEALNEANERPIILNGRQVNRAMKDGEVVLV